MKKRTLLTIALFGICVGCQTAPSVAPTNPFASDGVYALSHGDPAQQDATAIPGPVDHTRRLGQDEILYAPTGPASIGAYTSPRYPNGKRVLWISAINGIMKVDEQSYEILAQLPSDSAKKYTEEYVNRYITALDKDNGEAAIPIASEASGILKDVSGVYTVVDRDNRFYVAGKDGSITVYGDKIKGDPASKIEIRGRFEMPKEVAGPSLGMNMTYDGWIVLPSEQG